MGNGVFRICAPGGTTFLSNQAGNIGAVLNPNTSAWGVVSDRNLKENIEEVDYSEILENINKLPIYKYNYIGGDKNIKTVGPIAQDWNEIFPHKKQKD